MTSAPLVSVVIPAYNAAATLDQTLHSARAQTHRALEIIVVNDGSTDQTRAIAQQHAAVDDRVQILDQDNAGLAAARNAGWHRAQSDLIAFLDADDLWAPRKIERQLEALRVGGQKVGLVYCGSVRIDAKGMVTSRWAVPHREGDVLAQLFTGNFVGNGSVVLVRRQALIDANGFETALRAADAQGCEDYLLQCRIAEKYHFAVVPEHLVGYRHLPNNMSSNRPRMLRSWMLVVDEMRGRHPALGSALDDGLRNYAHWIIQDAVSRRGFAQLPALMRLVLRCPARVATAVLLRDTPLALAARVRARLGRVLRGHSRSDAAQSGPAFAVLDAQRGSDETEAMRSP
jgi:glycosyltransferase involved in cell wall biosynthesis